MKADLKTEKSGLPNVGNTCFLGSILQCLYASNSFRQIISRLKEQSKFNKNEWVELFYEVFEELWSFSNEWRLEKTMKKITRLFESKFENYVTNSQQDALQFLQYISKLIPEAFTDETFLINFETICHQQSNLKYHPQDEGIFKFMEQLFLTELKIECQNCTPQRTKFFKYVYFTNKPLNIISWGNKAIDNVNQLQSQLLVKRQMFYVLCVEKQKSSHVMSQMSRNQRKRQIGGSQFNIERKRDTISYKFSVLGYKLKSRCLYFGNGVAGHYVAMRKKISLVKRENLETFQLSDHFYKFDDQKILPIDKNNITHFDRSLESKFSIYEKREEFTIQSFGTKLEQAKNELQKLRGYARQKLQLDIDEMQTIFKTYNAIVEYNNSSIKPTSRLYLNPIPQKINNHDQIRKSRIDVQSFNIKADQKGYQAQCKSKSDVFLKPSADGQKNVGNGTSSSAPNYDFSRSLTWQTSQDQSDLNTQNSTPPFLKSSSRNPKSGRNKNQNGQFTRSNNRTINEPDPDQDFWDCICCCLGFLKQKKNKKRIPKSRGDTTIADLNSTMKDFSQYKKTNSSDLQLNVSSQPLKQDKVAKSKINDIQTLLKDKQSQIIEDNSSITKKTELPFNDNSQITKHNDINVQKNILSHYQKTIGQNKFDSDGINDGQIEVSMKNNQTPIKDSTFYERQQKMHKLTKQLKSIPSRLEQQKKYLFKTTYLKFYQKVKQKLTFYEDRQKIEKIFQTQTNHMNEKWYKLCGKTYVRATDVFYFQMYQKFISTRGYYPLIQIIGGQQQLIKFLIDQISPKDNFELYRFASELQLPKLQQNKLFQIQFTSIKSSIPNDINLDKVSQLLTFNLQYDRQTQLREKQQQMYIKLLKSIEGYGNSKRFQC